MIINGKQIRTARMARHIDRATMATLLNMTPERLKAIEQDNLIVRIPRSITDIINEHTTKDQ